MVPVTMAATPAVEQRAARLREEDAAAWDAYGAACRRAAPEEVRKSLFGRAMMTMGQLAELERTHGAR
jgi:hypothetical protein